MGDGNGKAPLTDFELGELVQMAKDTKEYVKDIHKMVKLQNGRVRTVEISKADQSEVDSMKKTLYIVVGIGLTIQFIITPLLAIAAMKLFA